MRVCLSRVEGCFTVTSLGGKKHLLSIGGCRGFSDGSAVSWLSKRVLSQGCVFVVIAFAIERVR